MDYLLLIYLPLTVFLIMVIIVLRRVIRFGDENKLFTNITVGVGALASVVLFVRACINYKGVILEFVLAILCIVFALFLKKLVWFFEDEFDKRNQIKVEQDEVIRKNEEKDFFDANERFNGEFTDYKFK